MANTMKAVFFKNREIRFIDVPKPVPAEDDVSIKVGLSGICNTDIELHSGYYGFEGIPGHEFVGVVTEAPGRPKLIGQRVVGSINIGCGRCAWCLGGDQRQCPERKALGIKDWPGAFAEYLTLPAGNVFPVPDDVPDEAAVFIEPLAAALAVTEQVHLGSCEHTAVMGDGKLGLLLAISLTRFSPGLRLLGKHENKLRLAARQGVATEIYNPNRDGEPFDVIIEATGRPDGVNQALDLVKPRGIIVAKTTSHDPSPLNLAKLVVNEIRLIGSRCGDFGQAISFLKNRLIDTRPLIEAIYPFDRFPEAFDRARQPGVNKVLLRHG